MLSSPPLSGDFFASCIITGYFREKFRLFPDSGPTLRVPLLVWVDDKPDNNTYEVVQARQMGIFVIELSSIAAAQAWVKANSGKSIIYNKLSSQQLMYDARFPA